MIYNECICYHIQMVLLRSYRVIFLGGVKYVFAYSYIFRIQKETLTMSSYTVITSGPQKSKHQSSPYCPPMLLIATPGEELIPVIWFQHMERATFSGVALSKDFKGTAISGRVLFLWFHFRFFPPFFQHCVQLCCSGLRSRSKAKGMEILEWIVEKKSLMLRRRR